MKHLFFKALASLGLGLLLGTQTLSAQEPNALLWQIEDPKGATSYLFGTYHLLGADYLKQYPKLEQTWKNCHTTVVETVIDSSQLMQMALMSMMTEQSLSDLIDSADYVLVKKIFETMELPEVAAQRMKPIVITAGYTVQLAQENTPEGFTFGGTPIDLYLATQAKADGRSVIALETMLEQMKMLYEGQSLEEQAADLVAMAKEPELGADVMAEIVAAYQAQDLQKMYDLSLENEEMGGNLDLLLHQRNANWIKTLEPILTKGNAFIAVGALHLPGEGGLIERLSDLGYKLSPVIYAE